jgi:hypothetical protein
MMARSSRKASPATSEDTVPPRGASGERALEGGPIGRPTVRGEHMLDRALEQRAQRLGDLLGRREARCDG